MELSKHYTPAKAKPKPSAPLARSTRRQIHNVVTTAGLQEAFQAGKRRRRQASLAYRAGEPSKFRHTATQLGGTADAHYWSVDDFWRIREYAREWDRNTPLLGQVVDRACDQVLGTGLKVDPQTDSPEFNESAQGMWEAWASDPDLCDFSARYTFDELERLALRHQWIDGDSFFVLDDRTGTVRAEEGDRVVSAGSQYTVDVDGETRDLVHGVELDANSGKPMAYYFWRLGPGERQRQRRKFPPTNSDELFRIERPSVVHVYDSKRFTQTRGITAFHAVFDRIGMLEDVEFAQLVQQQVAACIAAFIESEHQLTLGNTNEEVNDGTTFLFEEFQPGMVAQVPPGTKVNTFSPTNPTGDARELAKQIIREIGLAIGLPLELSLLITSDTTFHGYRGVVEAYKRTARRIQKVFGARLRSRVYRWKLQQWIESGELVVPADVDDPFKHKLHYPAWQYVDPKTDAEADMIRIENHLASPRQIWSERGFDYDTGVREMVEDRARLIREAQEQAADLGVTWQEILGMEPPPPPPAPGMSRDEAQAAWNLSHPAPTFNIHNPLPTQEPPTVNVEAAAPQPAPIVNVHVPEQEPPTVNLQNDIHVPEQPAPTVNVEPPNVNVEAPQVTFESPSRGRKLKVERDDEGNIIGGSVDYD